MYYSFAVTILRSSSRPLIVSSIYTTNMKSVGGYEHFVIHLAIYNFLQKKFSISYICFTNVHPLRKMKLYPVGERAAKLYLQYYYKYVYIACLNTYIIHLYFYTLKHSTFFKDKQYFLK